MHWLIALETNHDAIVLCRLVNIFRRKGLVLETLATVARPEGYSMMAVVQAAEPDVDHIFNFLRRTEGVEHVTCYRHETTQDASFLFINGHEESSLVVQIFEAFPGAKLSFASHGKYLFEIPAESRRLPGAAALGTPELLPFACVKTTRHIERPELVGLQAP
jgi:hypothetical protein